VVEVIARFRILLPFAIAIPQNENLDPHEFDRGTYRIRVHSPYRTVLDPHDVEMRSNVPLLESIDKLGPTANLPANDTVRVNGVQTYDANALQIDFIKDEFDRRRAKASNEGDPPPELGFDIANEFLQALRTVSRASMISFLAPDQTIWELAYLSDDGNLVDVHPEFLRRTVGAAQRWQVAPLNRGVWNNLDQLRREYSPSKWDSLLLDAEAMLPNVPSSISLANSALEMFSNWLLDHLPAVAELPSDVWEWFTNRRDHYQNPSIDDRYSDLLKILTGRSLKDEPELWQSYRDLRGARNNFAHTGRVSIRKNGPELTRFEARALIERADLIINWCEGLLPAELRRPPRIQGVQVEINKDFTTEPVPPESSFQVRFG
jgi:hypothetical protein